MRKDIVVRKVTAIEDIRSMQNLEKKIWGMEPIPIHQTITAVKNGGLIVGAFLGERMVGYSYSFAGYSEGQIYLCSHMLAVDEEFQMKGIGKQLKEEQLRFAREMGYRLIVWTFDPLESRNGYLNTSKLYGVCYDYIVDCYGEMDDGLNKGLPTDRFQVAWWIDSPRVVEKWQPNLIYSRPFQIQLSDNSHPILLLPETTEWLKAEAIEVPVPKQIQLIKQENSQLAYEWRMKTRTIFQQLSKEGFAMIDVRRTEESVQYYRFCKRSIIPLHD
ncbi:GNAT family N-acetyltransferase [Sporosarcina sp. P21c]|uniref:GNAT family N-acetyltransferase n=1 Tax=unclassified Sporosarcina TaxID=2647733 RepID=UPI000C16DD90|nr:MULTISPECIES: GNAT family N-acetyltransferase [unclassified Sporosarcina]PIC67046.1 GNAT family N-acetyltransferase [Sporosarcina sp. P16a]PIC89771.1 GNAT family N-acetyltransferase [Sporosarcina sp. P21c]PIC92500.1 GNAT family N-acetyltransferase [Sporosarcina sp. P25]